MKYWQSDKFKTIFTGKLLIDDSMEDMLKDEFTTGLIKTPTISFITNQESKVPKPTTIAEKPKDDI